MSKKTPVLLAAFFVIVSAYSYATFSSFKPKSLVPLKEVKGTKAVEEEKLKLPYPEDYMLIGTSLKDDSNHTTYKTAQTPKAIQTFYRNILISKGWEISETGNAGIFTTTKYKQQKKTVSVTTSKQPNENQTGEETTIVSLMINT